MAGSRSQCACAGTPPRTLTLGLGYTVAARAEFMQRLYGQPAPAAASGASEAGALPECCTAPGLPDETPTAIGAPAAGPAPAQASLRSPELVTKFAGEYGFVNKRLPVVKLAFAGPGQPALL